MKTLALAASTLVLVSSTAFAAPWKPNHGYNRGGLTPWERAAIARSAARLSFLKHQAWADGRLSFFERLRIRAAEYNHKRLVARELRD